MKIRHKKTLSDALKRKERINRNSIDSLGEKYVALIEEKKTTEAELEGIKTDVRALADKKGEDDGKRVVIKGTDYVGGYTRVDPSPYLDLARLKRCLTPAMLRKVIKQVETVDEKAFVQLVDSGKIPRDIVRKVTVCPPSTQSRFFLERRNDSK